MHNDQRKYPRRHLVYYLEVVDLQTGEVIGRLVDITLVGMMIISAKGFPEHQPITLRINLPEEFTEADHIDLKCESIWCHKDVNPDNYATGFRFETPALETDNLINRVVRQFGFRD